MIKVASFSEIASKASVSAAPNRHVCPLQCSRKMLNIEKHFCQIINIYFTQSKCVMQQFANSNFARNTRHSAATQPATRWTGTRASRGGKKEQKDYQNATKSKKSFNWFCHRFKSKMHELRIITGRNQSTIILVRFVRFQIKYKFRNCAPISSSIVSSSSEGDNFTLFFPPSSRSLPSLLARFATFIIVYPRLQCRINVFSFVCILDKLTMGLGDFRYECERGKQRGDRRGTNADSNCSR